MKSETVFDEKDLGVRVIIEGPECVGKDYFINKFIDYFNKPTIDKIQKSIWWDPILNKEINPSKRFIKKRSKRQLSKIFKRRINRTIEVDQLTRWSDVISCIVIDPWQVCPESEEFRVRIHKEKLDPKDIAQEFLQIHYDYELFARDSEKYYNLVIMNRSLASYKANQIVTDGFTEFEEKYEKLKRFSYNEDAFFIALTAPVEVIKQRYEARRKKDFRGEIEDKYIENLSKALQVYQQEIDSGYYTKAQWFDTTADEKAYEEVFDQIIRFASAQMRGTLKL